MNRKILLLFSGVTFICFSLGLVSCQGKTGDKPGQTEKTQEASANAAPAFALKDVNGDVVFLSDFSGKVVIIDFWATWCPPCKMEIPHFQSLYEEYASKGLVVIGIALDQGGIGVVEPFVKANGVTYPVLMGDQSVANSYGGIRGIPTTFIVDRNGNIVTKIVGYRDKAFFEENIKKLL